MFAKAKTNKKGEIVLDFIAKNDLVLGNTLFQKDDIHSLTYFKPGGGYGRVIDFILFAKNPKCAALFLCSQQGGIRDNRAFVGKELPTELVVGLIALIAVLPDEI
jgi:hypothetical protein